VSTEDAKLKVNVNGGESLPVGQHTFELVVTDESGSESAPAQVRIIVQDTTPPTAVLQAPTRIGVGESFELDASRSKDAPPGNIIRYERRKVE
jgi:hypothetical protein